MTLLTPMPQFETEAQSIRPVPVAVAMGDGIGPEIMRASLAVLQAAGAALDIREIALGEAVYKAGHSSGIAPETWEVLRATKLLYKAPITTPQGGGYKSLNVTLRKSLGLFANVRPTGAYAPFVATRHPGMDVVIVRENEEDLYAGIEHRQTDEVYQCLKLVSRPGTEKIVRFAFEHARRNGRKKVSCFSKDNIMKLTDGLFHKTFDAIARDYPEIETDHWIIDIGAARLASNPGQFDVIVTGNLYGDIISDIAAEIAGSVGLAPSANIGAHGAMFEAIHGSAPPLAGKDVANPSGLLLAGVMMLVHAGLPRVAERVHNAWLRTIEDGIHTQDIPQDTPGARCLGTQAFARAVIERLGLEPRHLLPVRYGEAAPIAAVPEAAPTVRAQKRTVGVDVFLHWSAGTPDDLAARLQAATGDAVELAMITNRGVKVWPQGLAETFCTDHWRCRFLAPAGATLAHAEIAALLLRLATAGLDFIKTEHLCTFDGVAGYSLGQGQ